jgi:hypothetical protein
MKSSRLVSQYEKLWQMVAQVRKAILNITFKEEDLDEIINMSTQAIADMNHFLLKLKALRKPPADDA